MTLILYIACHGMLPELHWNCIERCYKYDERYPDDAGLQYCLDRCIEMFC